MLAQGRIIKMGITCLSGLGHSYIPHVRKLVYCTEKCEIGICVLVDEV